MEPFKQNKIILDQDQVKETLTSSLQKTLTKQKKPVKFTWEGLKNFSKVFTTNPFDKMRNERLRELMDNKDKPKEKDYIDFFEDMEKSIYGAAQNIVYSFGATAARVLPESAWASARQKQSSPARPAATRKRVLGGTLLN